MFKKIVETILKRNSLSGGVLGIVFGAVVLTVVFLLMLAVPFVFDTVAAPFYILPESTGMMKSYSEDELSRFTTSEDFNATIQLDQVGKYAVFELHPEEQDYSFGVQSVANGAFIGWESLDKWFSPQTRKIKDLGTPAFSFEIEQPGDYLIYINGFRGPGELTLTVLPDYSSENQQMFTLACVGQSAVLAVFMGLLYRKRKAIGLIEKRKGSADKREGLTSWLDEARGE